MSPLAARNWSGWDLWKWKSFGQDLVCQNAISLCLFWTFCYRLVVIYHDVLYCSYRIFICFLPFYFSVTEAWCGNVLFCSYNVWLYGFKSCYSYYTFYFIGKNNNFEKHPDYVCSVFPNKQQAKRVVTPSRIIRSIRRNYIDVKQNGKYKSKAKRTLISHKESRTQELGMLCIVPTTSKNIPASPAGIITSEDSYANENATTFDL